jgi:Tol biopolymer transport system component
MISKCQIAYLKLLIKRSPLLILIFIVAIFFYGCKNEEEEPPDEWSRYNYTDPDWSPDGNLIIYEYGGNAYGTDTAGIFIFDLGDSTTRLLVQWNFLLGHAPDFSPDGEWVAFDANAVIWKIKIDGDSLIQLTFDRRTFSPDWSPDGKRITYDQSISTVTHQRGIYIMDADGNNDHLIIEYERCPVWSPDGSKIVYNGIYTADTNGTNVNMIHEGGKNCAWSPDGSKIAFAMTAEGEGPRIWVINVDGSSLTQITGEWGDTPC